MTPPYAKASSRIRFRIDCRAVFKQQFRNLRRVAMRHPMQRRSAAVGFRIDRRAVVNQQFRNLRRVVNRRHMQSRCAVVVFRVDIRAVVNQLFRERRIIGNRRKMQKRAFRAGGIPAQQAMAKIRVRMRFIGVLRACGGVGKGKELCHTPAPAGNADGGPADDQEQQTYIPINIWRKDDSPNPGNYLAGSRRSETPAPADLFAPPCFTACPALAVCDCEIETSQNPPQTSLPVSPTKPAVPATAAQERTTPKHTRAAEPQLKWRQSHRCCGEAQAPSI